MRHKNYFISLLFLLAALTASAQTCPGPPNRTALINLQRANVVNGTRALQTVLTDTCGNQRYVTLDSLFVIIIDSVGNWYTRDDTTTNALRTAHILESAQWLGDDPDGYLLLQMGTLAGGRLLIDTAAALWHNGLGGTNLVQADPQGIDITTSLTASRAVNLLTDTVNTQGRVDPTNFRLNFLSDNSYLFADSLKVVGIGQFPDFPSLNGDGTEKGFFYDPLNEGVGIVNGDGITGANAYSFMFSNSLETSISNNATFYPYSYASIGTSANAAFSYTSVEDFNSPYGAIVYECLSANPSLGDNVFRIILSKRDTNWSARLLLGQIGTERRHWGLFTNEEVLGSSDFYWIQSYLPNDTTENAVSFYNRAYYWRNEMPTGVAGDTLFHFWAEDGVNAGKNPGFMTLDQVCAHCAISAVNIYTSDGTTTDNTRIADVLETLTFRSDDVTANGVYPFRFELDGVSPNEPEMMVWKFPGNDSLMLNQSDQEITFRSTNRFLLWSNEALIGLGDSVQLGHLPEVSGGDIVALAGPDGSPGNTRTLKSLEGTFNADVLSWSAGSAGDRWDAVPANRSAIVVTAGSGTTSPALSVQDILVDGAGGGTISLDYTPSMPSAAYTTVRYIYNEGGDANVTVDTDQAWQFRDTTGDLGASFSLAAGDNAKLIWIYDATPANARFFVILF